MLPDSRHLLLIGLSARMLAQSAVRGDWQTCVADIYADQDTQQLAHQFCKIKASADGFDTASLLSAINQLIVNQPISGLIYGSGLESQPELLHQITQRQPIFGNSPQQVDQVKNPRQFFRLLNELDIAFPEVNFQAPENPKGWLSKPFFSEGGKGIQLASHNRPGNPTHYFQKQLSGNSYSALFLADGQRMQLIGFNRQYTSAPCPNTPFLFTGIINRAVLSPAHRQQIILAIKKLVKTVGLKGLNSLDFMIEGNTCRVLEINPRPSASMTLYDQDFARGMLTEHINACQGSLPNDHPLNKQSPVRAYHIIYAANAVSIPVDIQWPIWCADQPLGGTCIAAGEAICSINAEANTIEQAEKLIQIREMEIRNVINPILMSA